MILILKFLVYKPVEVRPKQNKSSSSTSSTSSTVNNIMTGGILSYIGLIGLGLYNAATDNHSYSEQELAKMRKEQKRYDSTPNDAYIVVEDNREDYAFKNVKIKCLKNQKEVLINYEPDSKEPPYGKSSHMLNWSPKRFYTVDEAARYICKNGG